MALLLTVLLPFLGCLPPLLLGRGASARSRAAWGAAVPTLAALAIVLAHAPRVFAGEVIRASLPWIPKLGLDIAFRFDGYSWLFAFLVFGIGLLIILYARYYLSADEAVARFFSVLMLFMGSMAGVVLSDNLLLLVIFWELTSLSSFLLIGYWNHDSEARYGARMALAVTGLGGLALLAGVILLGRMAGSYDLGVVLAAGDIVRADPLYAPMLILVLLGAFTKSAQFPFQLWLPRAMAAPTPVSAYLHSATMVKAGVFLLGRLFPVLAGTDLWFYTVSFVGLVTLLLGAYSAMFAHDLKGLLAHSTVSHLGLITMLFGFGTPMGAVAAVFHIMNHATFKASLFMAAGIIDHETGTRDMRVLNGLFRYMPYTATLAIVASGAMAGVPLLNGFLSKEMFFTEALETRDTALAWIQAPAAALYGILSVAYSIRFISIFFRGSGQAMPKKPHEPPRFMRLPVEALVLIVVAVGIVPNLVITPMLLVSSAAVIQGTPPIEYVSLWHGFNMPLLMSVLAMVGGAALFVERRRLYALHDRLPKFSAERIYNASLAGLDRIAIAITSLLENGSLQWYVLLFVVTAIAAGAVPLLVHGGLTGTGPLLDSDMVTIAIWTILAAAAIATAVFRRRRLVALLAISGVGLMVSLAFVYMNAPDLALTQLLVEIVTIMLLLLALDYLPQQEPAEPGRAKHIRDAALATFAGAGVAALAWAIMSRPEVDGLAGYFLENSVSGGGGHNVVNVILVDFRGYDTMGEITVLGIAALGILVLLSRIDLVTTQPDRAPALDRAPLLLTMITRALLPLAILFSIYLMLRGHNSPGGGFIGGLMAAVAIVIQYVASGESWTDVRLRGDVRPLIAIGLGIALLTGAGALVFGYPFLSATFTHVHFPVLGDFELATAVVFDLGVFLTVISIVIVILSQLGKLVPPRETDASDGGERSVWKP